MATTVSSVWQLKQQQASLAVGALRGMVDLAQPHQGLTSLEWQGTSLGHTHVLGVELASDGNASPLEDHYVRIGDLVSTYAQTATRPMRVQTYWRVASEGEPTAAIDLQISVQTSLLDSRPELAADSVLPTTEVRQLTDSGRFELIALSIKHSALSIPPAPSCWLFRLPGNSASYAEMVHPADFLETQLSLEGGAAPTSVVRVAHRLFATWLEKGVILRSRLRGVFLPREHDERLAAESYAAFAAEEPPLTT